MLKFLLQSVVNHKTVNSSDMNIVRFRLKSKPGISENISGAKIDSATGDHNKYGSLDLSSANTGQQQQQAAVVGAVDYPSVWTEQLWLERKRKHRWLMVSNGCLGCSVCCMVSQHGLDLSTDWVNCRVTFNGSTKSAQLKSLRAKILRHQQSTAHKEAERITQGATQVNVKQHQKMDKIEQRAVIKYLHKKGLTPKEIQEDMNDTLGASSPSYAMVKKWVAEFKRGRVSIEDDPRSGRPPRTFYRQPKGC